MEHHEAALKGHPAGIVAAEEMASFSETPQHSLTLMRHHDLVAYVQRGSASGGPALSHSSGTLCGLVGLLWVRT